MTNSTHLKIIISFVEFANKSVFQKLARNLIPFRSFKLFLNILIHFLSNDRLNKLGKKFQGSIKIRVNTSYYIYHTSFRRT